MNKELEERWKTIDEYINRHYKEYTTENKETRDNLQDVFNEFNIDGLDLNKNIPQDKKDRLDRKIRKILKNIPRDNYIYYKLSTMLKSKTITYRQLLEALINYVYADERIRLDEYENTLFYSVIETSYNYALNEIRQQLPPEKRKRISIFDMEIFYLLMNIPLLYGTREAYLWALAETNSQELYKRVIADIVLDGKLSVNDKGMQTLLQKQQNRYLKPDTHSGVLENMVESYYNLAYIQAGLDNGVNKVRFIARIDKRTTEMCETLNDQIFYTDKMNTYQRYSDYDGKVVTYYTKGLVLGENLPPINNHFHWCRSTITYQLDIKTGEYVRDNIKIANSYDEEQFNRYKNVLEDQFYYNDIEEFTKMKLERPEEWNELKELYRFRRNAIKRKENNK